MASTRQTNFTGGELAPYLHGRSDLDIWARGLATCRNFFPSRHGPAFSRPGTTYMRATKAGGDERVRLIPFVYSDMLSYVLEFGHYYIRFHSYGQTVESSPGVPLEVVTPYPHTDLPELQWAQVGAVLTLTHQNHPPATLSLSTGGTWTLADIGYVRSYPRWDAIPGSGVTHEPMLVVTPSSKGTLYTDVALTGMSAVSLDTRPAQPWRWKVTAVFEDRTTGLVFESMAWDLQHYYDGTSTWLYQSLGNTKVHLALDLPVLIRRGAPVTGYPYPSASANYDVLSYNFYRGKGEVFGFVGSSNQADFVDDGIEPDYNLQPPIGTNPFELRNGSADNPAAVTFFEDRRHFGGTPERPGRIFSSAKGEYANYDKTKIPWNGMPLEVELLTQKRERIRAMASPRDVVIVGTDTGIWAYRGAEGQPLDYDTVSAKLQDGVGCQSLPLLTVDNSVLWVRNKGRGVRALLPDQNNGYRGVDISVQSQHLFLGGETPATGQASEPLSAGHTRQIVDWCYAEDPWGLVWAVRDDGALLSLTFVPGQTNAWARHDFVSEDGVADGFVHAICSVPEGSEDAVYLVIQRDRGGSEGTYYLERMNSRVRNDSPEDDAAVDCCLRYQGAPVTTITGLGHLEGRTVWAVAVGNEPMGPLRVLNGEVQLPRLPDTNTYNSAYGGGAGRDEVVMFIGLSFRCDIELLDVVGAEARVKQKKVIGLGFEVDETRGLKTGQTFTALTPWAQRTVAMGYGATEAETTVVKVQTLGTYDYRARACLRQDKPLPLTVLGVVRELDIGG